MKRFLAVVCGWTLVAMASVAMRAQTMVAANPAAPKVAYYIDPMALDVADLIPNPPADPSAELAELHRIEATRTPDDVTKAKADEDEEDMFAFKTVFGVSFNAKNLPVTAELGVHVKNEQSVAGGALKAVFARPRPYQVDKTLHPACAVTDKPNSYPSGHALTGYLEALTLAELVPKMRVEILARADNYAHNRLVCGVHYPSDVEASRRVAYVVFGYMLATPRFQHDLAAAKVELAVKLPASAK